SSFLPGRHDPLSDRLLGNGPARCDGVPQRHPLPRVAEKLQGNPTVHHVRDQLRMLPG
ncbi:MAG: hypothetical protein L6R42_002335, partial [Xanthoria sp. 1 TBL-2021]